MIFDWLFGSVQISAEAGKETFMVAYEHIGINIYWCNGHNDRSTRHFYFVSFCKWSTGIQCKLQTSIMNCKSLIYIYIYIYIHCDMAILYILHICTFSYNIYSLLYHKSILFVCLSPTFTKLSAAVMHFRTVYFVYRWDTTPGCQLIQCTA